MIVGLAFIVGCFYLFLQKPAPAKYLGLKTIKIGETLVRVEVADTDRERIQGLSGRQSLEKGFGMFFIFQEPGGHGIWMKNMRFLIDIAWIDSDMRIVWVEKNVSPETFPQVFYPPSDVLYVLEVPVGTFEENNIDIGDFVSQTD